jgi:DNA-binding response OmpR family regulator
MAKILLVEDSHEMASTIITWLKAEHYDVVHSLDGLEGLDLLKFESFDVAILDWELPAMTGVEICQEYRKGGGRIPVLILTAKQAINERTTGLDSGADDYLTKPFALRELSARLRALLRRPAEVKSNVLEVGQISLDTVKYRILKNGKEVQLMPRDFALLEFLMKNVDHVFSAEALLARVWAGDSEASPSALRTAIKRIRQKLDDSDDEGSSLIENIPRVGYRLRAK